MMLFVAVATTVLLWASAFIGIRAAAPHFEATSLSLLRMAVGTLALGVIVLIRGFRMPPLRLLPWIAIWGFAWFSVYNIALNTAERTIDAGTASMLVNLAPLLVIIFGGIFLAEGFPRMVVIGAPVSFLGVILIGANAHGTAHFDLTGVLLGVASAVLAGGSMLMQKRLLREVDAVTMTFLGAAFGTITLLPFTGHLMEDLSRIPSDPGALGATAWVVYMGIFPTAIAFTTWAYVLRRATAGQTASTTYLVPLIVVLMSWLILGEVPTPIMLIGGVLCLAGVLITRMRGRRPH